MSKFKLPYIFEKFAAGGYTPPPPHPPAFTPVLRKKGMKVLIIMNGVNYFYNGLAYCWLYTSGVPGIPRQGGQAAASIHFSEWGGGGVKNFGALRAQSRNI